MHISKFYDKLNYNFDVKGITSNSKEVKKDYIFVAIKGKKYNGNNFINEALTNGAMLVVTSSMFIKGNNIIYKRNLKDEYIRLLQIFYCYDKSIYTVGVTGTDGKTTTSIILNKIFNNVVNTAYIGTNGISYCDKCYHTKNTTPSANIIYQAYKIFTKYKIKALVMEASSEGILDKRINNIIFNGAIFTNLSHEHLNSHKTMNKYFKTKAKLFSMINENGIVVANSDDVYFYKIKKYTKAKIVSYGINSGLYKATNIYISPNEMSFNLNYKGNDIYKFKTKLFGKYNIYNILASVAYSYEIGIPLNIIYNSILEINNIDGRFIKYNFNDRLAIIDYAHTPNGLKNLLKNISLFKKNKLLLVIGSQGMKDKSKRPMLGDIAGKYADVIIFTSEDPKDENIFNIFYGLTKRLKHCDYYITISRYDGIKLAYDLSNKNDIIVIIGKGNEKYEYVCGYKFHHNDLSVLKNIVFSNNN